MNFLYRFHSRAEWKEKNLKNSAEPGKITKLIPASSNTLEQFSSNRLINEIDFQ